MPQQQMTPQRMREIAALLLRDEKRYMTMANTAQQTAAQVEANPSLSATTPGEYRQAAFTYTAWANDAAKAARELQEYSFTMKGQ